MAPRATIPHDDPLASEARHANILVGDAERHLATALAHFDQALVELRRAHPNASISALADAVASDERPFGRQALARRLGNLDDEVTP